jgi:hypothetical protein
LRIKRGLRLFSRCVKISTYKTVLGKTETQRLFGAIGDTGIYIKMGLR